MRRVDEVDHVYEQKDVDADDGLADAPTTRVTAVREENVGTERWRPTTEVVDVHHSVPAHVVARRKAEQVIWFFFGILETLLALRVLLFAVGANRANEFFRFVAGLTWPFAAPFSNLVDSPRYGDATLELGTLFAMIIYLLVAVCLVRLVDLVFSREAA